MRVLQIHNEYFSGRGGEDTVIDNEAALLGEAGIEVVLKTIATQASDVSGVRGLAKTAIRSIYSQSSRKLVREWVNETKPDVVHIHNTFPLLSPSIIHEFHSLGIPTVLTLHNYRNVCANALLMREGSPCRDCLSGSSWNAVKNACYKESKLASAVQVGRQLLHDWMGTYTERVSAIIVLSNFARDIFIESGIPAEKLHVKPNFVAPSGLSAAHRNKHVTFVGRLVEEKGVVQLVQAWLRSPASDWHLNIVGDGPKHDEITALVQGRNDITLHGWKSQDEVRKMVAESRWLALPSIWYEGFPMTLVEAMAEGTPVIVPNLGAMPEIAGYGTRGHIFDGTIEGLAQTLNAAKSTSPSEYEAFSSACLSSSQNEYASSANLLTLMSIYRQVRPQLRVEKAPVLTTSRA